MHRLRTILILAPLLLIAATCVTDVRQRGPAGPWVGEVTNYSSETIGPVAIASSIFNDTSGLRVPLGYTGTCPSQLKPGQTGAFEVFAPESLVAESAGEVLRLRISSVFDDIEAEPVKFSDEGLSVRLVERIPEDSLVIVELQNHSTTRYDEMVVCGTLRSEDGQLIEVGTTKLYPAAMEPGSRRRLPVIFNSMPDGDFEFFASGELAPCCQSISLHADQFRPGVEKVINYAGDYYLFATGEVANPTSLDLTHIQVAAHASSSWAHRATPSPFATEGCGGVLPAGGSMPVFLSIPLPDSGPSSTVVAEVVGAAIPVVEPFLLSVDSATVGPSRSILDGQLEERTATTFIRNRTDSWVDVLGICLVLRDADGRVVGMNGAGSGGYLGPGHVGEFTRSVVQLAPSVSVDVIAFAARRDGPPEINPPSLVP